MAASGCTQKECSGGAGFSLRVQRITSMKRSLALLGTTLTLCALAGAQETTGNRVEVPARNTSHPRVANVKLTYRPITVKTYSGKEVIVESTASARRTI